MVCIFISTFDEGLMLLSYRSKVGRNLLKRRDDISKEEVKEILLFLDPT